MEDKKEIYKALAQFQSLVKPIQKENENPFYKSSYASLDTIQEHIKPILIKCGLVVIQGMVEGSNILKTTVAHAESGQFIDTYFPVITVKQDAQGFGSAMSYAKRYSISGILNLAVVDSDDDGEKAVGHSKELKPDKKPAVNFDEAPF